jgi:membrane-associated phospholipid phosphatase
MIALLLALQLVNPVADWSSYATATVNPTVAAVQAWKASDRICRLEQLALSEVIGNGLSLTLKHVVSSPRPCVGCVPDGFPSGHSVNASIGFSGWQWGFGFAVGTGLLRIAANRHTPKQVVAGMLIGIGADAAGRLVRCDR